MSYAIQNTQHSDFPFVCYLFDEAIGYQKRNGYPFWPDYDKSVLLDEISTKNQYKILIDHRIVLVFSVCYSDGILWGEKEKQDAIYLHRIVVNPHAKGKRHFEKVLNWAIDEAQKQELSFIRMDTWADNPVLIDYYESYGFQVVGSMLTPDSEDLPIQQRNNQIVLLEFVVNQRQI